MKEKVTAEASLLAWMANQPHYQWMARYIHQVRARMLTLAGRSGVLNELG